jgi:hypothetical protein
LARWWCWWFCVCGRWAGVFKAIKNNSYSGRFDGLKHQKYPEKPALAVAGLALAADYSNSGTTHAKNAIFAFIVLFPSSIRALFAAQALPQHPSTISQHHGANGGYQDGGGGKDGGVDAAPRIAEYHLRQGGYAWA